METGAGAGACALPDGRISQIIRTALAARFELHRATGSGKDLLLGAGARPDAQLRVAAIHGTSFAFGRGRSMGLLEGASGPVHRVFHSRAVFRAGHPDVEPIFGLGTDPIYPYRVRHDQCHASF